MSSNQVQLNTLSLLKVPIETYEKDFTFIVNGREFKTSRLVSDLLSTTISRNHVNDPTLNTFYINTKHSGDFSLILQLTEFKPLSIEDDELPFFIEVIEILKPPTIEIEMKETNEELNIDNIFTRLEYHNQYRQFFDKEVSKEISFISSHLYEILDKKKNELKELDEITLTQILSNDNIQMKDEDQFMKFCNEIYTQDHKFYFIFEFVQFENVSKTNMKKFTEIFEKNDMTEKTWHNLCNRLIELSKNDINQTTRYNQPKIEFETTNTFKGIIKHIQEKTSGQIDKEINITASSICNNNERFQPRNVVLFDDQTKFFLSNSEQNSWICFDFKEHQVLMTGYTIKTSVDSYANGNQPKSFVIEGSNDNNKWITIDEERECQYLKGTDTSKTHTFKINNDNNTKFRYIRMKLIDKNWSNNYYLFIDSFEIYGNLI